MRRIQLYLLFIAFALTLLLILVDSQSAALWAQTPVATATTVPITAFIHPSAGDAVAGFVTISIPLTPSNMRMAFTICVCVPFAMMAILKRPCCVA